MAIQTLSFISLILRPFVQQEIDPDGWAYLLNYSDPHRNFDGEIMAFGAMSGNVIDRYITELTSFGYVGPEKDESSDMVLAELFGEPFEIPSWVEIVDVSFFDENLRTVRAWKKKDSEVYKLINFESDINHRTKGYECDWSPHIGKIG
ncbi:hypothetical protein N8829_00845 [bacterium]|nr:hypothetical protein [bacterium]